MRYQILNDDGCTTLQVSGHLTVSDRDEFDSVIPRVIAAGASSVTVDIGELDHLDSAGLGMLLSLTDLVEGTNSRVTLSGAAGEVRELIEAARFGTLFTMA